MKNYKVTFSGKSAIRELLERKRYSREVILSPGSIPVDTTSEKPDQVIDLLSLDIRKLEKLYWKRG